jgi:hypothetical protein
MRGIGFSLRGGKMEEILLKKYISIERKSQKGPGAG